MARRERTWAPHTQRESYCQPYVSIETAKYNTSAHEPRSAAPASHITASTNATGISKKRAKTLPIPADKGAAEEVRDRTGGGVASIGALVSETFTDAAELLCIFASLLERAISLQLFM
jgi:hypothetical protein